jgi:hypothetical protein
MITTANLIQKAPNQLDALAKLFEQNPLMFRKDKHNWGIINEAGITNIYACTREESDGDVWIRELCVEAPNPIPAERVSHLLWLDLEEEDEGSEDDRQFFVF